MAELGFKGCARLMIAAVVLCCGSFTLGQDYSPRVRNPQRQGAYQLLVHAQVFTFGGVGFAATITPEEKAFHALFDTGNSLPWFKRLLKDANSEGQMYALYGLYLEDPDAFKQEVARLQTDDGPPSHWEGFTFLEKGQVRTAHGCIFGQQSKQSVIAAIKNGDFDLAFRAGGLTLTY